jgi:hypothetical protein
MRIRLSLLGLDRRARIAFLPPRRASQAATLDCGHRLSGDTRLSSVDGGTSCDVEPFGLEQHTVDPSLRLQYSLTTPRPRPVSYNECRRSRLDVRPPRAYYD